MESSERISKPRGAEPPPGDLVDSSDFNERIVGAYNRGTADAELPADEGMARSWVPAATAALRDFSHLSLEIPNFIAERCVGCMECVTECPDSALHGIVLDQETLGKNLAKVPHWDNRASFRQQFALTTKYHQLMEKKGEPGGYFGLFVDPTKCKGCGECVEVCGEHQALRMVSKTEADLEWYQAAFHFLEELPETPAHYINEKSLADMMLAERSLLYVGGAGSCMGCGEATAIRMMLAATGFVHGPDSMGIVAATGCNTVFGSTYPFNPYRVPWTNSLFENAAADAMGIRLRWDQIGWRDKKLWVIGGDGALADIGFQSLSRMLVSGMDIKVLVLDTQAYSNTGGQASSTTYMAQDAKMSAYGSALHGKRERRKELGQIAIAHPDVFVAQTTPAHTNHFYKAILAANEFPGPAVINCYSCCLPEHGVADHLAAHQARLAVDTRVFPLFVHDPRKGPRIKDRLSLQGNPSVKEDWHRQPRTREEMDFIYFARTEGRFAKQFDREGNPSPELLRARDERLANWHLLQELAGIR